ncbi:MAG: hypothetical protein M0R38_08035 [Bacteroidia bacterium]|nr:hypothetical protein [Bacteroidia bacterium]
MKKDFQAQCFNGTRSDNYLKFRKIILLFISLGFIFINIESLRAQTCTWSHSSEIDCPYRLVVGFTCDCGYSYHHHPFIEDVSCPTDCGCWGQPGSSQKIAGCGFCGFLDDTLCPMIGGTRDSAFKYLETRDKITNVSPIPNTRAYDWRNANYQKEFCNYTYDVNTVICCDSIQAINCQSCGCGVAEINWQTSETFLRPAHSPYYQPCPNPNQ